MLGALASSFLLIFISEMGDKTQLTAMAFTAKFKPVTVIAAVSFAVLLTNLAAVAAGSFLSGILPFGIIKIVSCVLFILFGVWTLAAKDGAEGEGRGKTIINPFFTVAFMFFISELGDKTQIAAMTLAMNENPYGVFAGASLGMICANLAGIGAGILLGKKLPEKAIKYFSAALFIIIGAAGLAFAFFE
jgi:putative Ca2+/H+ antiporter (TMEM165/GDT1 family)